MGILVHFGDVETGKSLTAQYCPTELKETHAAEYARLVVPGLSHEIMQFTSGKNSSLELEFEFNSLVNPAVPVDEQRKWLLHFLLPSKNASGVRNGAPPRCLFYWPNLFAMTCRVTNVEITHTWFNADGSPSRFKAKPKMEEARDARLTSEDVLTSGTMRAP